MEVDFLLLQDQVWNKAKNDKVDKVNERTFWREELLPCRFQFLDVNCFCFLDQLRLDSIVIETIKGRV